AAIQHEGDHEKYLRKDHQHSGEKPVACATVYKRAVLWVLAQVQDTDLFPFMIGGWIGANAMLECHRPAACLKAHHRKIGSLPRTLTALDLDYAAFGADAKAFQPPYLMPHIARARQCHTGRQRKDPHAQTGLRISLFFLLWRDL